MPTYRLNFQINGNQIIALAELRAKLESQDYFNASLDYDALDRRTIIVRFHKFNAPGWIEYAIDQNGDTFENGTGGLD